MEFPTQAERAIDEWRAITTKTVPFEYVALRSGAFRAVDDTHYPPAIEWLFPDESIARITGRGAGHQITAELP